MNEIEELFGYPPLTLKQQESEELIVGGIVGGIEKDIKSIVMREIINSNPVKMIITRSK